MDQLHARAVNQALHRVSCSRHVCSVAGMCNVPQLGRDRHCSLLICLATPCLSASFFCILPSISQFLAAAVASPKQVVFLTIDEFGPAAKASVIGISSSFQCSAVWGLMRTARLELGRRVRVLCIDTDAIPDGAKPVQQLRHEGQHGDDEVVQRRDVRYSRKLQ